MLATKSYRDSYRGAVVPETKARILVYDVGQTSVYPRNRDARGFDVASSATRHSRARDARSFWEI